MYFSPRTAERERETERRETRKKKCIDIGIDVIGRQRRRLQSQSALGGTGDSRELKRERCAERNAASERNCVRVLLSARLRRSKREETERQRETETIDFKYERRRFG